MRAFEIVHLCNFRSFHLLSGLGDRVINRRPDQAVLPDGYLCVGHPKYSNSSTNNEKDKEWHVCPRHNLKKIKKMKPLKETWAMPLPTARDAVLLATLMGLSSKPVLSWFHAGLDASLSKLKCIGSLYGGTWSNLGLPWLDMATIRANILINVRVAKLFRLLGFR